MTYPSLLSLAVGALFGAGVSALALRSGALSRSGALAASILGMVIFGMGGWAASVVLMAFFLSSSLLSRLFRAQKRGVDEKYAKGHRRDAGQVLANAGAAALCLAAGRLTGQYALGWGLYCAALAAANADTWATELGVLSPTPPRLITTLRPVDKGTSGGVSWVGLLAALLGAGFVAASAATFSFEFRFLAGVTAAGLAGALVDSLLGASLQAIYYCPACRKETERHPQHSCGAGTRHLRGWRWLDNDWVNFGCTATAVLVMLFWQAGRG